MLELGITRGQVVGNQVLIGSLDDVRALMAERAHSELVDLTSGDFGKDAAPGAWRS